MKELGDKLLEYGWRLATSKRFQLLVLDALIVIFQDTLGLSKDQVIELIGIITTAVGLDWVVPFDPLKRHAQNNVKRPASSKKK